MRFVVCRFELGIRLGDGVRGPDVFLIGSFIINTRGGRVG